MVGHKRSLHLGNSKDFIFTCCDCMFVRSIFKASLVCKGGGWKPDDPLCIDNDITTEDICITPANGLFRGSLYSSVRQI